MIDEAISTAKAAGTARAGKRWRIGSSRAQSRVTNALCHDSARTFGPLHELGGRPRPTSRTGNACEQSCEQLCEYTHEQSMDKYDSRLSTDIPTAKNGRYNHRSYTDNSSKFISFYNLSTNPHVLLPPLFFKIKYRSIRRSLLSSIEPPPRPQNRYHTGCGDKGISWSSGYSRPNS